MEVIFILHIKGKAESTLWKISICHSQQHGSRVSLKTAEESFSEKGVNRGQCKRKWEKWEEWGGPCDHPREINEKRTNGHSQMGWWRHRDMFRRVDLVSGRCRDWIWFGTEKLNAIMSGHWCEGREDMFVFVSLYLNLWRPRLVTSIWMSGRESCWRW